jgi:hypothetical protein
MRAIVTGLVLIVTSVFFFGTSGAQTATTVTCKDGTTATAGRGACHGHGGVAKDKKSAAEATSSGGSAATVTCKDGTTAAGGRGACHGHGGVAKSPAGAPAAAAPAAASAPVAAASKAGPPSGSTMKTGKAASTDPSGALAKCHDGVYWHGTKHSGACSHHGGVDTWLDGSK